MKTGRFDQRQWLKMTSIFPIFAKIFTFSQYSLCPLVSAAAAAAAAQTASKIDRRGNGVTVKFYRY